MGKRTQHKRSQSTNAASTATAGGGTSSHCVGRKLSHQKRHELNQLIDSMLKLGFNQSINITEQWNNFVEIRSILDRIQSVESVLKVKCSPRNRLATIAAFTQWVKQHEAQVDGVNISEFAGYDLGLQASKDFTQGELFATIPKKLIMSEEILSASLGSILSPIPMFETMSNVKLAITLLIEKLNPESFWKPYLDLLPDRYTTVMYFSVNDMQELKGSNVLPTALNQCKNIARQYAFIYKCLHNLKSESDAKMSSTPMFDVLKERFTFELYCWAVSTVMTRQNSIPRTVEASTATDAVSKLKENGSNGGGVDGDHKSEDGSNKVQQKDIDACRNEMMPALIPFWDLTNHKHGEVTSSYNMESDRLESFALTDFKKGEQIFIYYGNRSNGDFLVHNGFVYSDNAKDSILIRLGLSNSDELFTERSKILKLLGIPERNCELKVLPAPDFISSQLLAFSRVFNMNRDQLQHWICSERASDLLHIDCALETSLESKTWMFLQTRLNLLLKIFPTTLEADETILESHQKGQIKLGHTRAMLLKYRILEKKILAAALEYAKERTKA